MAKHLHRLRAEDASASVEYVGFAVVVAAVIAVLFSFNPSIGDRLQSPVDTQVCDALGDDCAGDDLPNGEQLAGGGAGAGAAGGSSAHAASAAGAPGAPGGGAGETAAPTATGTEPGGIRGAIAGVASSAGELVSQLAGLLDQGDDGGAQAGASTVPQDPQVADAAASGAWWSALPSAHSGVAAEDGTTDNWFHGKREAAAWLHETAGSGTVGLFERGWHVLRAGLNAPVSAVAWAYSEANGGSCSASSGLILSCTGQTRRSYWQSHTFQVGNVTLSSEPKLDASLQAHETRHADQWGLLGPGLFMLLYGAETLRTRRRPWRNIFERDAGLEDGGYLQRATS